MIRIRTLGLKCSVKKILKIHQGIKAIFTNKKSVQTIWKTLSVHDWLYLRGKCKEKKTISDKLLLINRRPKLKYLPFQIPDY